MIALVVVAPIQARIAAAPIQKRLALIAAAIQPRIDAGAGPCGVRLGGRGARDAP